MFGLTTQLLEAGLAGQPTKQVMEVFLPNICNSQPCARHTLVTTADCRFDYNEAAIKLLLAGCPLYTQGSGSVP